MSDQRIAEARGWLIDAFPGEDMESQVPEMPPEEVMAAVAFAYDGGWDQFVRDTASL